MARDIFRPRSCFYPDASLLKALFELFGNLFILHRHNARQHFQHRDLRAEPAEDRSKFHTYGTRANNPERGRNFGHIQNLNIRENKIVVRFQSRQHTRFRTSGKNDILRFDGLCALIASHFNPPAA